MDLTKSFLIKLPSHSDERGSLTVIENEGQLPFTIKRIFYIYDVPQEARRASHAHYRLQELIIPAAGSFTITLDDGTNKQSFTLDRPDCGLYVPPLTWVEIEDFSAKATCLVFASAPYDASDYCQDYTHFLKARSDNDNTIS